MDQFWPNYSEKSSKSISVIVAMLVFLIGNGLSKFESYPYDSFVDGLELVILSKWPETLFFDYYWNLFPIEVAGALLLDPGSTEPVLC